MTDLVTARNLHVCYRTDTADVEALRGVDLVVRAGERVAVIGESGSGKSTLALAIAGLLPSNALTTGALSWPGLRQPPRNGPDIGFVFQDPAASLDPVMSVGDQVAEVARVHLGLDRRAARDLAANLFGRVRLPDPRALLDAYPHQLSGGQKQRVGIAAAIIARPALLIADEPTSALDTIVQAEIVTLIGSLVREFGMSLLMISHDIALAAGLADHIVVVKNGLIVEAAPADEIILRPRTLYTRALLAACLVLDAPATVRVSAS